MPFITQKERKQLDGCYSTAHLTAGQRCYLFYRDMVKSWRDNPRWTTADKLYQKELMRDHANIEDISASQLAWQVFFIQHVMPYEIHQLNKNGDI